jgi:hypothetical protein
MLSTNRMPNLFEVWFSVPLACLLENLGVLGRGMSGLVSPFKQERASEL